MYTQQKKKQDQLRREAPTLQDAIPFLTKMEKPPLRLLFLTPQTLAPASNGVADIIEPGRSLSLNAALVLVALMLVPSPFKAMVASIIQEK